MARNDKDINNQSDEPLEKTLEGGENQLQIRTLTRLRDTLLPKLMRGKVRAEI